MEEQNRNKETALGEARRPSSVEEAEAAIEAVLFAMGDSVELGRIAKAIGHDTETMHIFFFVRKVKDRNS